MYTHPCAYDIVHILIRLHQVSSLFELPTGRQYVGRVSSFEEMASSASVSRLIVSWLGEIDIYSLGLGQILPRTFDFRYSVVRFILRHTVLILTWEDHPTVLSAPPSATQKGKSLTCSQNWTSSMSEFACQWSSDGGHVRDEQNSSTTVAGASDML